MSNTINDTETNYTTPTGDGENIILDGPSDTTTQTIISNGTWDNIDLNGHTAYVYINIGAAINGNGGILTENNGTNSGAYLYGNYAGLYATLVNQSTADVTLTGNGNITNDSTRTNINERYAASINGINANLTVNGTGATYITGTYNSLTITLNNTSIANLTVKGNGTITNNNTTDSYSANIIGDNASITVNGNGNSSITGTYNGLNYADITAGSNINASANGNNYLGEDLGSIIFTQGNGTLTINGINNSLGSDSFIGSGNNSNLNLTGDSQLGNIGGNWNNLNGIISGKIYTSNATFNNASIYNKETNGYMTITGTGNGNITYNGVTNAEGDIKGTWQHISATIQSNDSFNATGTNSIDLTVNSGKIETLSDATTSNYNNITLNNGSALNATLKYGTNTINTNGTNSNGANNFINIILGTSTSTLNTNSGTYGNINEGSGQLNINYNINNNNKYGGKISIANFNQSHTQILLTNTAGSTFDTSEGTSVQITHNGITDSISVGVGNAKSASIIPVTGTNNALLTFN